MGLAIDNYKYSYSTLQDLRKFALDVEKNSRKLACKDYDKCEGQCVYCSLSKCVSIQDFYKVTKFPAFINHSDCDGGYFNFTDRKVDINNYSPQSWLMWADLNLLKVEMAELKQYSDKLDFHLKNAFDDFYDDVMNSTKILKFS